MATDAPPPRVDFLVMHEDLLGYLLGALEPHEMRRVAEWLQEDPEAREQLAEIERSLRPLEDHSPIVESPPVDLVSRTMASLPPFPSATDSSTKNPATKNRETSDPATCIPSSSEVTLRPMQPNVDAPDNRGMAWIDWVGGAAAVVAVLGLLLPSIAQGRFESRKIACQDHLRQLGTAITQFVSHSPQDRLPGVSASGPEAFAGVYAVRLNEAGLLSDPSIRWCPSLDPPTEDQAALTDLSQVVSLDDLHEASVDRLQQIQQFAGGHYAYTLGVVEQDRLMSPRYESRTTFAVMSDAPLGGLADPTDLSKRVGHGATGINVLYEDGRVRFIPWASLEKMLDHPLLNHRREVEAGVNVDDASLGPSWRPPFVDVRQR